MDDTFSIFWKLVVMITSAILAISGILLYTMGILMVIVLLCGFKYYNLIKRCLKVKTRKLIDWS